MFEFVDFTIKFDKFLIISSSKKSSPLVVGGMNNELSMLNQQLFRIKRIYISINISNMSPFFYLMSLIKVWRILF
jgi:hypothetical protein